MESIMIDELINIIPSSNVIDIRDKYKYNMGCIPGSRNIPYNFLVMNPGNYLDKDKIYYLYCDYGNTSKRCTSILSDLGYDVVNIDGGYNAYCLFIHHK